MLPDNTWVLVVEDDPDHLLLARHALRAAGAAAVVTAGGFAEARAVLEEVAAGARPTPRLVVSDLHLPEGTGLELLAWMRRLPGMGGVRFAVLSASANPAELDGARVAGAEFVTKPATRDRMAELLGVPARG